MLSDVLWIMLVREIYCFLGKVKVRVGVGVGVWKEAEVRKWKELMDLDLLGDWDLGSE